MSLEDLEREVYSRSFDAVKPGKPAASAVPESPKKEPPAVRERWEDSGSGPASGGGVADQSGPTLKKKLMFFGIGILSVALVGIAVFVIGFSGRGGGTPVISIDGPDKLYRGVPFDVTVGISNQLEGGLRTATLNLTLPPGIVAIGGTGNRGSLVSEPLGDLGSGVLSEKSFKLLPIGDIHSIQKITASVSYGTGGRGRFEASESREVSIDQSAIQLEIKQLDKVLSGSTFTVDVSYKNVSGFDFPDVSLAAQYPSTFKFKTASLDPDSVTKNLWRLGEIAAGSEGTLSFSGIIEGPEDARYGIPVELSANFGSDSYVLGEKTADIVLAPSPITLGLSVNGTSDYVAKIGDQLVYRLEYKNTSGIALADVVIKAALAGELYDANSIGTEGQLDSRDNSVTWNASVIPQLRLLDPGSGGTVNVAVKLLPTYPIRRLSDKNYTVKFAVAVDSPSVPFYLTASKTTAMKTLETKVGGLVTVDAQGFYRDAKAGFVNLGSLPPKVNQSTEFTLHWVIKNYATDVKDVRLSSFLEGGVAWTGQVNSNIDSVPLFNERTQEVTWLIDKIAATKGILGAPIEAIFQVRATPNVNLVNGLEPLMGETKLVATDEFTGGTLESGDRALSTALPDDPTVGQNGGIVIP